MKNKPNLLLVFSDQHRWSDLNCMGNPEVISPNFDKFSKGSTVFTQCISNCPVCVPARGSLLTGQMPLVHGAIANDLPINTSIDSIAHVMNAQGYETGYIGKWHLAGVPREAAVTADKRLGFKEWKVANCTHAYMDSYYYDEDNKYHKIDGYEPITQTNLALEFIDRHSDDKPWGLVLSWGPPHDPYDQVPECYKDMYRDMTPTLRENFKAPAVWVKDERYLSKSDMEHRIKDYYAHVTALDTEFGRLIDKLEETNQLDNTIVVYTSDHGDMLGSQGLTNKQCSYEESIRIPLMVYWKGHTISTFSDELIGLIDLPVSLMSLMGMTFDGETTGTDLSELFTDHQAKGLDACYIYDYIACHQAYRRGEVAWRGIRTKDYTYTCLDSGNDFVLFDLKNDPYQLNNLIDSPTDNVIKARLQEKLNCFINKHDGLYDYESFIKTYDLVEAWNKSQAYFNLPLVGEQKG